jgi:hypothetical protein
MHLAEQIAISAFSLFMLWNPRDSMGWMDV